MEMIDQIKISNNSGQNDIGIEWQGHSNQAIKVIIKYRMMGKKEWSNFIHEPQNSMNQMVSVHRELRGERGMYSFLFSCNDVGMEKEIASYQLDNIMLGRSINVSYHSFEEKKLNYLEFIDIEDNRTVPANYFYIEMEHRKYPIGISLRTGSKIAIPKVESDLELHCILPYDKMYRLIQLK